jgi:catechol 2,3-dioxygenase-like lactoylglutathione lyase family enzyme
VKTLFVAYRVSDLDRSLHFYTVLGYAELGRVEGGHLVILKFPGEPAASLELVHRLVGGRVDVGSGVDHLAIQVDTLAATLERLTDAGLEPGPCSAGHAGGVPPADCSARRSGSPGAALISSSTDNQRCRAEVIPVDQGLLL